MINISVVVECKFLDQLPKAEIQRTGAIDLLKKRHKISNVYMSYTMHINMNHNLLYKEFRGQKCVMY